MYITADDIEKEISFYYPIDNRNANKKVGLIRAYERHRKCFFR